MKYNKKYNLYVNKEGSLLRYDKRKSVLVPATISNHCGYEKCMGRLVQRIVWETFNGEIPEGLEVDHINDVRDDNRLENLQLLSHKDNCNKDHRKKLIGSQKTGNSYTKGMVKSQFGSLFFEKYGFIDSKSNLYQRQFSYYKKYGYLKD